MPTLPVQKVPRVDDRSLPIFAEFDRFADRIRVEAYKLFARRGAGDGHALEDWLAAEHEVCWPAAELAEREGRYTLRVTLPGFEAAEISVTATPREIIVKAASKHQKTSADEQTKVRWSEFRSNDVFRRVELPAAVDVEKVTASLKNGLLEIVAPRQAEAAAASPKKIEVAAGS